MEHSKQSESLHTDGEQNDSQSVFQQLVRYSFDRPRSGTSVKGRLKQRLRSYSRCVTPQRLTVEEEDREPAPAVESPLEACEAGSIGSAGSGYVYQSPRMTIRDTNEQIKRNSSGRFGSLLEFAQHNHVDTTGKVFAHCAETGDKSQPTIDLDVAAPTDASGGNRR